MGRKKGKPEDNIYSYHDTQEEAVAEVHAPQGGRKSFCKDVPILIMDYGQLETYAS